MLGLTLDEFPTIEQFREEAFKSLEENYQVDDSMKAIFNYFKHESQYFYAREMHSTNTMMI